MDYGHISKVQKAKQYADERQERVRFESFEVELKGENGVHRVTFRDGVMETDTEFFKLHGYSAHTMAMERLLEGMIPSSAQDNRPVFSGDSTFIAKYEKAKRYAEEAQQRIRFKAFVVHIQGNNDAHRLEFRDGKFYSEEDFFKTRGYSAHSMAMERILEGMLEVENPMMEAQ